MQKLTCVLLILVIGTLRFSSARPGNLSSATIAGQQVLEQRGREHYQKLKERFPTADYNQVDSSDPEQNAKRRRYNDGSMVSPTVYPWMAESMFIGEPPRTFPVLPVVESDLVVVGTVGRGQAHLSENKKNIFSEFTLIVEDVLKSKTSGMGQGSHLTVDRIGGHVLYPNGQRVLYRVHGGDMPQVGSRYLFFLTSTHNKEDFSILTGFELTEKGAVPLDEHLTEAAKLSGVSEKEILQRVSALIANASK